jgi:hypothetical protein
MKVELRMSHKMLSFFQVQVELVGKQEKLQTPKL